MDLVYTCLVCLKRAKGVGFTEGFITIENPEILHIEDKESEAFYYGADQTWYDDVWKKRAGCGPTSCSHVLWYLSQTIDGMEGLCPYNGKTKPGFIKLMEDVWDYVTPTKMGVNKPQIFIDGAINYGLNKGFKLKCESMELGPFGCKKQSFPDFRNFIAQSLGNNYLIGFLNLSNGEVKNLDNWHWVTLIGIEASGSKALMYDQRKKSVIDIELWHNTTLLGGGIVTVMPDR